MKCGSSARFGSPGIDCKCPKPPIVRRQHFWRWSPVPQGHTSNRAPCLTHLACPGRDTSSKTKAKHVTPPVRALLCLHQNWCTICRTTVWCPDQFHNYNHHKNGSQLPWHPFFFSPLPANGFSSISAEMNMIRLKRMCQAPCFQSRNAMTKVKHHKLFRLLYNGKLNGSICSLLFKNCDFI